MAEEIGNTKNDKLDIKDWFENIGYFKFLMQINKNIFLNKDIEQQLLKNALINIKKYINISKNNFCLDSGIYIEEIFNYWKNNDITLSEFKNKLNLNNI
ncbi:MAG: hypothetical protein Q9M94_05480 [Candidatus Gracilibacteria bacterium]|nr:hypothetical protein [Candidatus Gracilibacteria bacterium]MDQ7022945.1 hypothetical protein [Candidatus Gracilibacteria bacterium]